MKSRWTRQCALGRSRRGVSLAEELETLREGHVGVGLIRQRIDGDPKWPPWIPVTDPAGALRK